MNEEELKLLASRPQGTSNADLQALLYAQQQQAMLDAAEKKKRLEDELRLRLETSEPQVDLTPLAALSDMFTGGKLTRATAQQAEEGRGDQKRIDDLSDALVANARGTASSGLLAKMASGGDKQDAITKRFEQKDEEAQFKYVFDTYNKERKAINELESNFRTIENALSSGNIERIKGSLANYARAVNAEKGPLAEGDIGRTFIPTLNSQLQTWNAYLGDKTGKLKPEELENLAAGVRDARAAISEIGSAKARDFRTSYEGSPYASGFRKAGPGVVKGLENSITDLGVSKYKRAKEEAPKTKVTAKSNPFRLPSQ